MVEARPRPTQTMRVQEVNSVKQRSKLLRELVSERKKVDLANKELFKKMKDNELNVTNYYLTMTDCDNTIANREIELAKQKAVLATYKI
jgi:hypothetical protein